jgi:hypothetical protein
MLEPPSGAKHASAEVRPTADLSAHMAYDAWNRMQKTAKEALDNDKAFQEAFSGAVAAMSGRSLEKSAETAIIPFIGNFGGPKAKESFLRSLRNVKYANAFLQFYDSLEPFNVTKYAADLAPTTAFVSETEVAEDLEKIDEPDRDREKARFITEGFAILDRRKNSDKSVVYQSDLSGVLAAPSDPGVYDIWRGTGTFRKTYVFWYMDGTGPDGAMNCVAIGAEGPHRYTACAASSLIASKAYDTDLKSISKSVAALRGGSRYFIFDPESKSGFIARLGSRRSGRLGHIYTIEWLEGLLDNGWTPSPHGNNGFTPSESFAPLFPNGNNMLADCEPSSYGERYLCVSSLPGSKIRFSNRVIAIPDTYRVIELCNDYPYELPLGSQSSLDDAIVSGGFNKLKVDSDGIDFTVQVDSDITDRLSKKEACLKLVKDLGLSVPDADELVARAEARTPTSVLFKRAQLVGASVPMPVPPGPGPDPISGLGIPTEQPFIENQTGVLTGVPPTQDPTQPNFAVGGQSETEVAGGGAPAGVLPEDVMQLADDAAQAGQKHVFDHSTIAGLAGIYDIGYAIDMYVPELVKSLDRVGRILFIFYWKNDEFAERYGEQDLAGMEDLLRNVFKSFGSLVLRLQEKSVAEDSREMD